MSADFVFLHGGGQGGWVWGRTIAALQRRDSNARALALDVPGCGEKRARTTDGVGVADIARELIGDIEAAALRDVVLVGHSQAGTLLPAIAELRPPLFRRLIYLSCSIPSPGQTIVEMMGTGLRGSHGNEIGWPVDPKTASFRDRYAAMFCNDMTKEETAALVAKLGRDAWPAASYTESNWRFDRLDDIPATYVVCLRDGILPVEWQETFAARLRAQRIVRIDAGHQAMLSQPEAFADIILKEVAS